MVHNDFMDFQQSFYFMATIFMGLGITVMIIVIYVILKIERRVNQLKEHLDQKISSLLEFKTGCNVFFHFLDWLKQRRKKS